MRKGAVTIVDVARLAGVSTATVSRTMHAPLIVRQATREKVTAAMRECGYVYNATAGDFSRRKSTVIGVLILSNSTKVATSVYAAQRIAMERHFPLLVGTSGFDPNLERKHLQQFLQRGVAGVLVVGHTQENLPRILELRERGIPSVFLWDLPPEKECSYVGIDNTQGMYAMVDRLIQQGHKRIGFICGINAGVERITRRYQGYRKALAVNNLPLDSSLVCSAISSYAKGRAAMLELMAIPNPPRCVCCASDVLAIGAVSAVREKGLNVPQDFCVTGFDNASFSSYCQPPLSTVNVPSEAMGRLGMKALMTLVSDGKKGPICKELNTKLMMRSSTCPAGMMNPPRAQMPASGAVRQV